MNYLIKIVMMSLASLFFTANSFAADVTMRDIITVTHEKSLRSKFTSF